MFGHIFTATFLCLVCFEVFAAQIAVVSSDWAIIYADRQMSAPIAKVKKGKKIKIGEVKRNKGRLYPIVVNGKIAYIKATDIQTSSDIKVLEQASERIIRKKIENNKASFEMTYAVFGATYEVNSTLVNKSTQNLSFKGYSVKSHLLYPEKRFNYRLGIEHIEGKKNLETVRILSFDADKNFYIYNSNYFQFNTFIGATIIPYAQYKVEDLFTVNGYGLGAFTGIEMIYKFSNHLSMHLDTRFKYAQLSGFNIPEVLDAKWEPKFYGAHATLGLSYSY